MIRIIATVPPTAKAKDGAETLFYRLNRREGIKIPYNVRGSYKNQRESAWTMAFVQAHLAERGLAPKVLAFGKVADGRWGYKTEIASQPWIYKHRNGDKRVNEKMFVCKYQSMYDDLQDALYETGFGEDTHRFNVGIIKRDGRDVMVLIDTGWHCWGYCSNEKPRTKTKGRRDKTPSPGTQLKFPW